MMWNISLVHLFRIQILLVFIVDHHFWIYISTFYSIYLIRKKGEKHKNGRNMLQKMQKITCSGMERWCRKWMVQEEVCYASLSGLIGKSRLKKFVWTAFQVNMLPTQTTPLGPQRGGATTQSPLSSPHLNLVSDYSVFFD